MVPLKVGDSFPLGVIFDWAPIRNADPKIPPTISREYDASKEWKGKRIVLFSVPGAFTPLCQVRHLPPYIEKLDDLKNMGVDIVAVIGYNDPWTMCAWGKVNGISDDRILFLSDTKSQFSKNHGWGTGMDDRNGRWAMIIDDDKVFYAENETDPSAVTVSSVNAILAALIDLEYAA
ncbi:AhpC/TSA family protein-like protein [Lojkania enalia]|uniref:AhpC/TSA family protein-like protein n=1 Tax=Lojkania enalia TaxID=147567 RepID=A0A9P4N6J0_9PLEO|nr:AhpC/TSA family protein-like protein [Didymosphaeria enalia]